MSSRPPLRRTRSRSVLPQGKPRHTLRRPAKRHRPAAADRGAKWGTVPRVRPIGVSRRLPSRRRKLRAGGKILRLHIERFPVRQRRHPGSEKEEFLPCRKWLWFWFRLGLHRHRFFQQQNRFFRRLRLGCRLLRRCCRRGSLAATEQKMRRKAPVPVSLPVFHVRVSFPVSFCIASCFEAYEIRLLIIPQLPAADFQTFIKLALQHSSERQLLRLMEIQRRIFILLAPSRDFAAQNQIFCTLRVRQLRNRPDLVLCRLDMLLLQMKTAPS